MTLPLRLSAVYDKSLEVASGDQPREAQHSCVPHSIRQLFPAGLRVFLYDCSSEGGVSKLGCGPSHGSVRLHTDLSSAKVDSYAGLRSATNVGFLLRPTRPPIGTFQGEPDWRRTVVVRPSLFEARR